MTGRVLVTGAAGLLGSQILKQAPPTVTIAATSFQRLLPAGFTGETYLLDLSNADSVAQLLSEKRYDVVINCAGASDVDRCETDHEYALQSNVAIVRNFVEGARRNSFRLLSFSSDYVFDGTQGPYAESDRPNPVNYYGRTKLLAEESVAADNLDACIIQLLAEESVAANNLDACIVRVCSLYATSPTAPRNLYRGILESLAGNKVYRAAVDLISNPTEVTDLAQAVWQLVAMPKLPRVLHLASPDCISRYELAVLIAKKLDVDTKLIERVNMTDLSLPAQRPRRAGLKSDLANSLLGRELKSFVGIA
ncbi:MAG: SDR family oxidoreductase [candidate division Zixibacteria bacterium]|nr:SDR family oxidoreductase [candidate division Zixibacteria bacterium]